jgi:hypothetical protein
MESQTNNQSDDAVNAVRETVLKNHERWLEFVYSPEIILQVPAPSGTTPHACIQVVTRGKLGNPDEAIEKTILHLQQLLKHRKASNS